jgi:hypothetical protein
MWGEGERRIREQGEKKIHIQRSFSYNLDEG